MQRVANRKKEHVTEIKHRQIHTSKREMKTNTKLDYVFNTLETFISISRDSRIISEHHSKAGKGLAGTLYK